METMAKNDTGPGRGQAGVQGGFDPGPQGSGGGAQAPGHVHRVDQRERPAPPRLRGGGQRDRRGAGGPLRLHQRHHPRRQLDHGPGQRARDPGGHAPDREDAGRRGGAHGAARRRQVRQELLQGVGRPARRRRLGGERAVGAAGGPGGPGRAAASHAVRARQDDEEAHGAREGQEHRHPDPLQARPGDLHRPRVSLHDAGGPAPSAGVSQPGRDDHHQGRAGAAGQGGDVLRQGRADPVRASGSTGTSGRCTPSRFRSARPRTTSRWSSRCSTRTATTRTPSPS